MAVRTFFVNANVDGRKHPIRFGPRSSGGGMDITLYQRDADSASADPATDHKLEIVEIISRSHANEGYVLTTVRNQVTGDSWKFKTPY